MTTPHLGLTELTLRIEILGWLTIIPKWLAKGWYYYRRPTLKVYLNPAEAYLKRSVEGENTQGLFCHLMVSNEGKGLEKAKNCKAQVIEISVPSLAGSGFTPHPMFLNPFVLKWAHESDYDPKDIEKDLPKRLDLCYGLQSKPCSLFFFTPQMPNGNLKVFPPGLYHVKVRVDADNAKAIDKIVQVNFKGEWDQITLSEVDE